MATTVLLSIVVPLFNEEEVLPAFHKRLSTVLDSLTMDVEVIYVNDGSSDNTLGILENLKEVESRVAIIDLSRNFGKEFALLPHTEGKAADRLHRLSESTGPSAVLRPSRSGVGESRRFPQALLLGLDLLPFSFFHGWRYGICFY